jgi:hypothetical protein
MDNITIYNEGLHDFYMSPGGLTIQELGTTRYDTKDVCKVKVLKPLGKSLYEDRRRDRS